MVFGRMKRQELEIRREEIDDEMQSVRMMVERRAY